MSGGSRNNIIWIKFKIEFKYFDKIQGKSQVHWVSFFDFSNKTLRILNINSKQVSHYTALLTRGRTAISLTICRSCLFNSVHSYLLSRFWAPQNQSCIVANNAVTMKWDYNNSQTCKNPKNPNTSFFFFLPNLCVQPCIFS